MFADARDPDAQTRDALVLHRSGNLGAAIAIYRALLPRTRNGAHLLFLRHARNVTRRRERQ